MVAKVTVDAGRAFDVDVVLVDLKTQDEVERHRFPRDTRGEVHVHTGTAAMVKEVTAQDIVREMKAKAKAEAN